MVTWESMSPTPLMQASNGGRFADDEQKFFKKMQARRLVLKINNAPPRSSCLKTVMLACRLLAVGCSLAILTVPAMAQAWKPSAPVELIATNAPGGGSDRILRIFVKILTNNLPTPASVVNKPGGGGAIAYNYVNQHPGEGHHLVLASRSILTNNIAGNGPSYTSLTPVVHLFTEYISVTVKPNSPIKSGKQLIDFMRRDPTVISFGIATSLGGMNHQGAAVALKVAGIDLKKTKNVIFPSGGVATTALLGGHIDVVPISAAFGASLLRNQQIRMIAVTSPKRLHGVLADIPTWKEQGFDAEVTTYRYFTGPKGMTSEQIAFWEKAVERTAQADEWKKELAENYWQHKIMGNAELVSFLAQDEKVQKDFLSGIGLSK
jgi:putative tricarboxylic transport membrane protein